MCIYKLDLTLKNLLKCHKPNNQPTSEANQQTNNQPTNQPNKQKNKRTKKQTSTLFYDLLHLVVIIAITKQIFR